MKDYSGLKSNMLTALRFSRRNSNITYWLFKCDCGIEKEVRATKVFDKKKSIKSCGCLVINKKGIGKNNEYICFNIILNNYKNSAKRRNYTFSLKKDVFKKLIMSRCFYCDSEPSNIIKKGNKNIKYNGIDRKNNNLGYDEYNSVSCCTICNRAKGTLSFDDFISWINTLKNKTT